MNNWRILIGDVREQLSTLPAGCVRTCVTSPPYWGLRDYGVSGQLGLESTPEAYVAAMVGVFADVRRVLSDDGTIWVNLGDCYNAYNGGAGPTSSISGGAATRERPQLETGYGLRDKGRKAKDLLGIPWMVAFALRADGWYLRSDIIWSKPNPMPESVTDRPTKAHEYIFLLSKSKSYYYDAAAIKEPIVDYVAERIRAEAAKGMNRIHGDKYREVRGDAGITNRQCGSRAHLLELGANKRSVWNVATSPYPDAHFATFPEKLIEPCILAGSAFGDTVLDPFTGSGTTGAVAIRHQRNFIGCELNPAYVELARKRIGGVAPMFAQEVA